jgi:hypothetical protein
VVETPWAAAWESKSSPVREGGAVRRDVASMDGAGGYLEEEVVAERGDGGVGLLGERGVHGGDVHRRRRKRRYRRGGAGERKRGF